MKKIITRGILLVPALILQLFWYWIILKLLSPYGGALSIFITIFSFFAVLYIVSTKIESNYKILWLIIILSLPVLGTLMYIFWGNKSTSRPLKRKLDRAKEKLNYNFTTYIENLESIDRRIYQEFKYIESHTSMPTYPVVNPIYYSTGDDFFKALIPKLESAKKFIYMEFFIVERGELYDRIVEILARKVKEGVDVRFIYDDLGSISKFSMRDFFDLTELGVKCVAFNPLKFLRGEINSRDHRKMVVIDNKIAFSGGNNLADEYANIITKFGHWKDVGFSIEGKAVLNYTVMFIEFWNAFSNEEIELPTTNFSSIDSTDGYALSYYDSPFNRDAITNNVFIDMLSNATEYIWFYTPYLIIPASLEDALIRCAHRGVDVKIFMPGIPDKKLIYRISRSYYPRLLEDGIKVYEYTPGFLHAKAFISDDKISGIGTVNLDFRSLYLHFENNTLFFNSSIISELKADMERTEKVSREVKLENMNRGIVKRLVNALFRIFAPLL